MSERDARGDRCEGDSGRVGTGSGGWRLRGRGDGRGPGTWCERDGRSAGARLPEELRALGRSLATPVGEAGAGDRLGAETMVERVLGRVLAEQVPVPVPEPPGAGDRLRALRRWARLRRRSLTAGLCGLLTVLVLTPPVRAAVVDWFDFGGIEVRYDPSAMPSPGAKVPGCGTSVSLGHAEDRAAFEPLVPDTLGMPDTVAVTDEPHGRFLVSLCWREGGHIIRLDEFPARLDVGFAKTLREPPEWISLDGTPSASGVQDYALWFPRPHLLSFWLVDVGGHRFAREVRTAGPTLLWTHETGNGNVTLRLEGVASRKRAVEIAESLEELSRKSSKP